MATPDFLCIGAQKAGTTWLNDMFKGHPQLWTPLVKELQFFSELFMPNTFNWTYSHRKSHALNAVNYVLKKNPVDWKKIKLAGHIAKKNVSIEWYERIFDYAPTGSIKGEMTPEYSLLKETAVKFIASKYPSLKIIFVMREPLSRALSGIRMRLLQQGFDKRSDQDKIDEFVISASTNWDVIQRGNYKRIIPLWTKYFGENNCLWLMSDDFKKRPHLALKRILNFLRISDDQFQSNPTEKVHVGKQFNISDMAVQAVKEAQAENIEWYNTHKEQFFLERTGLF